MQDRTFVSWQMLEYTQGLRLTKQKFMDMIFSKI